MNMYRFYHGGMQYCTCYGNEVARNHISACADLARKGLTPYTMKNENTGKDVVCYTDSFSLEFIRKNAAGEHECTVIGPSTIDCVPKTIRKELSAFDFINAQWKAKIS